MQAWSVLDVTVQGDKNVVRRRISKDVKSRPVMRKWVASDLCNNTVYIVDKAGKSPCVEAASSAEDVQNT